jgi:hypothetical protein
MRGRMVWALVTVLLALAACGAPPTPTPDAAATAGALERARPTATPTLRPSPPVPTATPPPRPSPALENPPAAWPQAAALARQVEPERLMADVRWLADDARRGRQAGTADEDVVRDWLVERFEALGLEPWTALGVEGYVQPFSIPHPSGASEPAVADNVIGILPGTAHPERQVILSAHYDHLGKMPGGLVFNGADDNATGVAAVLEAARLLSAVGRPPEETLVFVAFSAEEIGLLGAGALCETLQATGLADRSQVVNLDVLGAQKGAGTYLDLWDEGSALTGPVVQALQTAAEGLAVPTQQRGGDPGSDARRLVSCGVPAATVSVAWSAETHPCIHQPCDDPWLLDVAGLTSAARVAVAAAWLLANDGQ